jgi:hypothetical protein
MYGIHADHPAHWRNTWLGNTPDGHQNGFPHGELEEEIYMEQPNESKEAGKEDHVVLLNKALYRLMQAAREWNKCLQVTMVSMGYTRVVVDHSVYVCTTENGTSIMAIQVDNMVAAASLMKEMKSLKEDLGHVFNLLDLGEVKWLLGMGI